LKDIDIEIKRMKDKYNFIVIFLEAEKSVLIRRYKETRRPHPLQKFISGDIEKAFILEKKFLKPIKELADFVIDTSSYTPHQLRKIIIEKFGQCSDNKFILNLLSFGYKFGLPQQADLVFDIRFLPNPYFVPNLKKLTGLDEDVKRYVLNNEVSKELLQRLKDFLQFLIPRYIKEGKSSLTIGIGCTGGKHRSPVIVEQLKNFFKERFDIIVNIIHREIEEH